MEQEYQKFLALYKRTLFSNKRYIFTGAIMLIALMALFVWWKFNIPYLSFLASFDPFQAAIEGAANVIRETFYTLLLCYFLAVGAWIICTTGWHVRKFTTQFELAIQPSHPDNSGGLRPLGNFCLGMALMTLMIGALLAYYAFIKGQSFWSAGANLLLIAFVFPLTSIAFFAPIWKIHEKMQEGKRAFEDEFANRIAKLEERIRSSLDAGRLDEARAAKEEIEIVQVLHPERVGYPVWPFDRRVLLTFLTPQILTLLTLVVQLGPIVDFFQHILLHSSS